ncbi:hypothetical protein PGB90_008323 [Kerria lacca]
MSTAASGPKFSGDRINKLILGELPNDFLRVGPRSQSDSDQQLAIALDRQLNSSTACSVVGCLNITIEQARLVKNYGITRMDPYVRLRVGHHSYETKTDPNGGKNPRWNKVVQCLLPAGVNSISVEIYDERSFTMDELIAWAQIPIPAAIFSGQTHEEWFPLNGKQGEGAEGAINLVLSYSAGPPLSYGLSAAPPVVMVPRTGSTILGCRSYTPVPIYQTPLPPPQIQNISADDLKMVEEMFPNMDKDVIKSVFQANNGSREAVINSLLQMS